MILKTEFPIIVTDSHYVLSNPITLTVQTGSDDLEISDASTKGQYFKCKSSFTANTCFRKIYDARNICIISSNPQDINGKSYKHFIAGDTTTPYVIEAHMDKLTFDNILFKCEIKTSSNNFYIFLKGNWRKKNAFIYLVKKDFYHKSWDYKVTNTSIPIAHIRAAKGFLMKKNYYFIDIAVIVALCMTLDGRILVTSGQFTYYNVNTIFSTTI
jgi:hypothetical protein